MQDLSTYADLGAPAKPSDVALVLTRQNPRAFLQVTFEPLAADQGWRRFEEMVEQADAGDDQQPEPVVRYTDSLAARIAHRQIGGKAIAALVAGQWNPRGVWRIAGGCAKQDLAAVRADFFLFVSSLQETLFAPGRREIGN
jgi:hypothetical protein